MKLKYYLRGLGIGILVTAVVMSVSNKSAKAEIIKEYEQQQIENEQSDTTEEDFTEEDNLMETQTSVTEDNRDKEKEAEINAVIETALEQENNTNNYEEFVGVEGTDSNEKNLQIATEPVSDVEHLESEIIVDTVVVIEIEPGDAAGNVAWKLHNAGVISDKEEFVLFLQQNGYDKKIRTGIKNINMNDDWDTIGKTLTIKDFE